MPRESMFGVNPPDDISLDALVMRTDFQLIIAFK
jgi:hypothetical protein